MEITIDTNKDSKEHIQQMIDFLQRFVGSQATVAPSTGMVGMFGNDAAPAEGMIGLFQNDPDDDLQPVDREDSKSKERFEIIPY